MNKRGFTLIELLSVITLIGLVLAISVPSVNGIVKLINNNMLNTKINFILEEAILYGEDNLELLKESNKSYNNYQCLEIIVSDLVPNYLDSDNDNICLSRNSEVNNNLGCIVNPSNKDEYLDKLEIIIYLKDNKVEAISNKDNNISCS